ncbi:ATP-binding cassette sub-family A member 9-like [Ambystoma mexicanum]|uniref:ATP-binding cassette sub-family A member 9-like n=1 Tax=Ambystoma mexicanum TaxID=8296 RepID=UPI0037E76DA2
MKEMHQSEASVCQQTGALLYKNLLIKWRNKKQSVQEWLLCLVVLLLGWLLMFVVEENHARLPEMPENDLDRLDAFNVTTRVIGYAPQTQFAKEIMEKVALTLNGTGVKIEEYKDDMALKEAWSKDDQLLGIVFKDSFSYEIRISKWNVPLPFNEFEDFEYCAEYEEYCPPVKYWWRGFDFIQASIDAAIVEITTNHSIWEQLKSTVGILMKFEATEFFDPLAHAVLIVMFSMGFFPLLYFLTLNVAREKKTHKDLLRMMGLRDSLFWLSWGLLYSIYIFIMANLWALIATTAVFSHSSYLVIFVLFFLYGISSMCFCFLLVTLLKKPKLTCIVGFLLTLTFGCLSLVLLLEELPSAVMWVLDIFLSPCTFSTGLTEVLLLENKKEGAQLNKLMEDPFPLSAVFFMLVLNAVLYMLLAMYFDQVLPNTYGRRQSPFFFLKSSYWCRHKQQGMELVADDEEGDSGGGSDYIEPVLPEFRGKEAIRIKNIKKNFKQHDVEVEALRGLLFDVYEGQITALLGHSGSGKTTLLNILSGLSAPSDGVVSIYKHVRSEIEDTLQFGNMIVGFCPQFDIKYDNLTVKENLRLFSKVRGIPSKEVEREVQCILNGLDITNIQDTRAANLSGGQKRKLTLGIALLRNPKILLLDEPTAGLDPCSRHHVWTLLKERKADRVTLFSTQFMDEADILADRKAVISRGSLKCVGTSMFLKRKWGIGYHLRMHVTESCNTEEITSVVKYHIPNATLSRHHEQEIIYTLPFDNVDSFSELFSDFDTHSGQEITNYGVSMTTLEDVFLKLEGEQSIEQADYGVFSQELVEDERDGGALEEMEKSLLSLSEMGKATVSGTTLWRQQVLSVARIRFLKLKHESKVLRSIVLLLLVFVLPIVIQISLHYFQRQFGTRELTPDLYLLPLGVNDGKRLTRLLIQNHTGSGIDDFVHSIMSQGISVDVLSMNQSDEYLPYNIALRVSREGQSYRFALLTNLRSVNGFPVLMNIISNTFLRSFNATATIRIWNNSFMNDVSIYFWNTIYILSIIFMGILASGFSPSIGMSSLQDDKIKALSQLRLSGLFPSAYWCGQAMVDVPLLWLLLFLMVIVIRIFTSHVYLTAWGWTALLLCMTGYSGSVILLVYVIAFIFRKGKNNPDFWACIFLMVTLLCLFLDVMVGSIEGSDYVIALSSILVPVYPLLSCLIRLENNFDSFRGLNARKSVFIPMLAPYLHCFVFLLLLRCLEMRYGKKMFRGDPIFRISPNNDKVISNIDEPEGDEDSVQDEKTRVMELVTGQKTEEDSAIVASSLRKEYKHKKASTICQKKKEKKNKVATRNISFCVKKGEILGLLGPNGAGKTTTIRLLIGDTKPTAGQVLITGVELPANSPRRRGGESTGFLGYCPQENSLWPSLTVQEHLEVYSAVKGMRKEDAAVAIKRMTDALDLHEQLNMPSRKLPEGVKRKLCFALSMLANPTVVLLDEPSTGMDPKGQQRVWRAIRAAFKNKERGAILTTHYMEEAEALCDRVAIMVSGKLRCIGSIQQLKSTFGKGYFLQIKVRDLQQVDVLHKNILKIFPHAARLERFSSLLSYRIPMDNVKSLSQAFSVLEEVKRTFNLEEYSFSQSTLEQVFIELTKEQDKDDSDLGLNTTFDWKQLHEEDA